MYEMTLNDCRNRLKQCYQIQNEFKGIPLSRECECSEAAKNVQADLLKQIKNGSEEALTELLTYYEGCVNAWAKDVWPSKDEQAVFKAELAARMFLQAKKLRANTFCGRLRNAAADVLVDQHQKILEWKLDSLTTPGPKVFYNLDQKSDNIFFRPTVCVDI